MTPEEVSAAVRDVVQRFQDEGVDGGTVTSTLLGYAIAVANDTDGPEATARHLYFLALRIRGDCEAAIADAMLEKTLAKQQH